MLRVYLDQNKWVDLARAATGQPAGARFADALAMCRAGVESGRVSFPLDMYRYWETGKRRNDRSRNDVVDMMRELSRQHTVATPFGILDHEIDLALQRRFGRRERPGRQQTFGIGMRHISDGRMDWPELDLSDAAEAGALIPAGLPAKLEALFDDVLEEALLRAGPAEFASIGFDHRSSDHAQRFVDFENQLAAAIAQRGLTGLDVDIAVRGADFGDIRRPVVDALERIEMTYEDFTEKVTGAALLAFMDDLPTRYVTNVMRSAKHRERQQRWELNDFVDIGALPVAAVYFDVVVTEKQWVNRLRHGGVERRYDTMLLNDVADLTDVLVRASMN